MEREKTAQNANEFANQLTELHERLEQEVSRTQRDGG